MDRQNAATVSKSLSLRLDRKTQAIMSCVDALEQTEVIDLGDLRKFLQDVPQEHHSEAFAELVRVDLERRWKRGDRQQISRYLEEYPELQNWTLDLLQTEFEIRQRSGEQPQIDEYRRIRPDFMPRDVIDTERTALPTTPFDVNEATLAPLPERVGKYRVVREVGLGGFGIVYEGYDEQLGRSVAIKVRRAQNGRTDLSDDLLHEARSIAKLDHPNIVRLLEANETTEGVGYLVYEYIDGVTLQQRIRDNDYDRAQAVEWVAQVADALHYAHQRSIIHRDIKPANILLDSAGRSKLVDFGLARREDQFYRNDAGQILGTLAYLSPEQASGESHWASSQSDLYSLSVVLYELLCRKRPFQATEANELLDQVRHRTPPPLRSIDDTIPVALEEVCWKSLAKKPAERYKTGADFSKALRAAMRPPTSRLPLVMRGVAALVAIGAVCIIAASLLKPVPLVPVVSPEISSYNILFAGNEMPVNSRLPLSSADHLKVEATFTRPAYGYLIVYEQNEPGRLIYPAADKLRDQQPVQRIIYPPLSGDSAELSVPDVSGATYVVALASADALSNDAIKELLSTKLQLNISPETAAQAKTSFQVADPLPKFHQGIPTRSGDTIQAVDLRVPDAFKQQLKQHSDAYFGNIVPHVRSSEPSNN